MVGTLVSFCEDLYSDDVSFREDIFYIEHHVGGHVLDLQPWCNRSKWVGLVLGDSLSPKNVSCHPSGHWYCGWRAWTPMTPWLGFGRYAAQVSVVSLIGLWFKQHVEPVDVYIYINTKYIIKIHAVTIHTISIMWDSQRSLIHRVTNIWSFFFNNYI